MFRAILFIVLFAVTIYANEEVRFTPFIDKQINILNKINDVNVTSEQLLEFSKEEDNLYTAEMYRVLKNKQSFIDNPLSFDKQIFALKKIININRRNQNEYAVVRDEVLIKSYEILQAQNKMMRGILQAIDDKDFSKFESYVNEAFIKNQEINQKINDADYNKYLSLQGDSAILIQVQKNILDFYTILDINADYLKYITLFEKKFYRLNKYVKYKLITPVVYISKISFVITTDELLQEYNLSVVKLLLILIIIAIIYVARKLILWLLEKQLLKIRSLQKYSTKIVTKVKKPIELFAIVININLIIYIYNSFITYEEISNVFNIVYVLLLTLLIYILLNAIADVKLQKISATEHIKNEVINITLKVINFTVWLIGLLFVMHFAGVNLTAILSGLGIGGLAVALAAKDSLANFFGTLSILISDTFSQGDWISVGGKEGVVVEIGLRVTTLRTFDNALIAIPNANLANNDVQNWNRRSVGRRIKMHIGVKYDSKAEDIKRAVNQIRQMLQDHPGIATESFVYDYDKKTAAKLVSKDDELGIKKILMVYLDEFASSSINILIYSFSKSVVWEEWLQTKEDVMYKIMAILEENSLEFAFPSLSIYNEE